MANFQTIFQLILQGALAVENSLAHTQPHETKRQLVVDSVDAVAKTLEVVPIPQVAGTAAAVDLGVETFAALYDAITSSLKQSGVIKPAPAGVAPVGEQPAPAVTSVAAHPIPIKA